MKPFFGIDLTYDKKNEAVNGKEFLVQTPSTALSQALDHSIEEASTETGKAKLPLPLTILQYGCGLAAMIIFVGILRADVTITQAYENAAWIFWLLGGCALVWLVLTLAEKAKASKVLATEECSQSISHLEGVYDAIFAELKIPEQAREVDLLQFYYKAKGDTVKPVTKGMMTTAYMNPIFRVYADPENLYISNLEGKYAIPQASILGIRTVKKHIRITEWNKDVPVNKGMYKQYKLGIDQYGCVHCQCYHIMEVQHNDAVYGFYIPSYELPVFEALTGKKAQ